MMPFHQEWDAFHGRRWHPGLTLPHLAPRSRDGPHAAGTADLDSDGEWDNRRLEGPSFVRYFRGKPHIHVWVHVADSPKVELNPETPS
jgi:hypothetical protein